MIRITETDEVKYSSLVQGDTFKFGGKYFVRTSVRDQSVQLSTGVVEDFVNPNTLVSKIEMVCQVKGAQ